MTVDRGREAVAAAEAHAFDGTSVAERMTRDQAHELVDAVVGGAWWRSAGPSVVVTVPRRSARSSSARSASTARSARGSDAVEVRLTDEQLSASTVAHELAHALAGVDHGHDGLYRSAYVDVVSVVAGADARAALADAFARFGLDVASRRWPAPWLAEGDDFVVIP